MTHNQEWPYKHFGLIKQKLSNCIQLLLRSWGPKYQPPKLMRFANSENIVYYAHKLLKNKGQKNEYSSAMKSTSILQHYLFKRVLGWPRTRFSLNNKSVLLLGDYDIGRVTSNQREDPEVWLWHTSISMRAPPTLRPFSPLLVTDKENNIYNGQTCRQKEQVLQRISKPNLQKEIAVHHWIWP